MLQRGLFAPLAEEPALAGRYFLRATRAELQRRLGERAHARSEFSAALALASAEPARRFLFRRLAELD